MKTFHLRPKPHRLLPVTAGPKPSQIGVPKQHESIKSNNNTDQEREESSQFAPKKGEYPILSVDLCNLWLTFPGTTFTPLDTKTWPKLMILSSGSLDAAEPADSD